MKKLKMLFFVFNLLFFTMTAQAQVPLLNPDHPKRIPVEVDGKMIPRELGCWFPRENEVLKPDGYKGYIDAIGNYASFDMIAVSSRMTQYESIDPKSIDFQKNATLYAREKYGIAILPDAEIRLSRKEFNRRYPDKKAEILILQEELQKELKELTVISHHDKMTDHYTHNYAYFAEGVRLVKAWSYQKNEVGSIIPNSIKEITKEVKFTSEKIDTKVIAKSTLLGERNLKDRYVCIAVAYSFLYPDIYSEEAFSFEREIFERHKNIPAGGCVKDEWGFLPCPTGVPNRDEFYYSVKTGERYAQLYPERDFVDDALLMYKPQAGREIERSNVIDAFNKMNLEQVLKYEYQLYDITKQQWGKTAFVATHPTWYCSPCPSEFRKNSLMWWKHPRDYAQTDEATPFPCRTGMAKTNGRLWYNEYYANETRPYFIEHWTALLGGGRVNIHPFCCMPNNPARTPDNYAMLPILDQGMERTRQRIRMLNFISDAPLYSPVCIVFGHFSVMNWTRPEFNTLINIAITQCQKFSNAGYPADLIPSSQINSKTQSGVPCWQINDEGYLQYGIQPYKVIVFYADTDSDRADFEHLRQMAIKSKTKIIVPKGIPEAITLLNNNKIGKQSPWESRPGISGFARMVDDTLVWANATVEKPTGLPLLVQEKVSNNNGSQEIKISAEAVGVLACRFDSKGNLNALAGSEIKKFSGGGLDFDLTNEQSLPDIALWKDSKGQWKGIIQSTKNQLPNELKNITSDWRYLQIKN